MKPTTDFEIPWPPSANRYLVRRGPATVLSKRAKDYRDHVHWRCHEQRVRRWRDTKLEVRIVAHPPDNRDRDLDNLLKCTLDALEGAEVIDDDVNLDRIEIERGAADKRKRGYLLVSLNPRENP